MKEIKWQIFSNMTQSSRKIDQYVFKTLQSAFQGHSKQCIQIKDNTTESQVHKRIEAKQNVQMLAQYAIAENGIVAVRSVLLPICFTSAKLSPNVSPNLSSLQLFKKGITENAMQNTDRESQANEEWDRIFPTN